MLVQQLLLNALEELISDDFRQFQWYLGMNIMSNCKPIAKCHLEKASREDTVDKMVQSYGEASAVLLTVEILKKMNLNYPACRLNEAYAEGQTAATSTSSSSAASAAPTATSTISAQQNSVVVAPSFTGGISGSVNININKA